MDLLNWLENQWSHGFRIVLLAAYGNYERSAIGFQRPQLLSANNHYWCSDTNAVYPSCMDAAMFV